MKDIIKKEIIGSEIIVVNALNKANIGIKGRVIDETKKTLVLDTSRGKKKVFKEQVTLELTKERLRIDGKLLLGRPEERIKKRL